MTKVTKGLVSAEKRQSRRGYSILMIPRRHRSIAKRVERIPFSLFVFVGQIKSGLSFAIESAENELAKLQDKKCKITKQYGYIGPITYRIK